MSKFEVNEVTLVPNDFHICYTVYPLTIYIT